MPKVHKPIQNSTNFSPWKFIQSKYTVITILILALILRLIKINQSLWLDESIGAYAVKNFTFKGLLEHFFIADNHPPLYYLTLKVWTSLFGYSELALRMPSILFGVATIYISYLIAIKLAQFRGYEFRIEGHESLTRNTLARNLLTFPNTVAILLATSQLHIYYSQEARMYSMAAFFASLAIYSFLNVLKKEGFWWIMFSLSIVALLFSDYVPVFLIPVFWIVPILIRKKRTWWIKFIMAHFPLAIFGILWWPMFLKQAEGGRWLLQTLPAWKQVAGGATFKQAALLWTKYVFGRISLPNKPLFYFLILLASIPYLITFKKAMQKFIDTKIIWLWLTVPPVLGFIASFWFPVFIYFRFLYILPAFYLLVSLGVFEINNLKFRKLILLCLIAINCTSFLIYVFDERQQREKWREAVSFIEEKGSVSDIVLFENTDVFAPYRWYAKGKVNAFGAIEGMAINTDTTLQKTSRLTVGKNGVFYFEYLKDLFDPQGVLEEAILKEGYTLAEIYSFSGVGHVKYYRR